LPVAGSSDQPDSSGRSRVDKLKVLDKPFEPLAAARPLSSAAAATRTSTTTDAQHGNHDEHWRASCYGKRARLVREGAVGKGPDNRNLAGGLLHVTYGSVRAGGCDAPGYSTAS
jgi:hypothetical protein